MLRAFRRFLGNVVGSNLQPAPVSATALAGGSPVQSTVTFLPASGSGKPRRPAVAVRYGSDFIALVGFNDTAFRVALPARPDAAQLTQRVNGLHKRIAGNYTNIAAGLRLGLELMARAPVGQRRRLVLLSDGEANIESDRILDEARRAREMRINIDCIAFGPDAPTQTLRAVAEATHRGRMHTVSGLRSLRDALIGAHSGATAHRVRHRSELTVYVVDCSSSMTLPMPDEAGKSRMRVVQECLHALLIYKQTNWM